MTQGIYEFYTDTQSIYIGQSINCERRKQAELNFKHRQINNYFKNYYMKHSSEIKWRILEKVDDRNKLIEREFFWINTKKPLCNLDRPDEKGYNWTVSESTRRKMRDNAIKQQYHLNITTPESQQKSYLARISKNENYQPREDKYCKNCEKKLNISSSREKYEKAEYCLSCYNTIVSSKLNKGNKNALKETPNLLQYIKDGLSVKDMAIKSNVSERTIHRRLKKMREFGLLEDLGGTPKTYQIAKEK